MPLKFDVYLYDANGEIEVKTCRATTFDGVLAWAKQQVLENGASDFSIQYYNSEQEAE